MILTGKEFAAAKASVLLAEIFADDRQWTCRYCGSSSSIMGEFCNGCGLEDCNQGQGSPVPVHPASEIRLARAKVKGAIVNGRL